MKGILKLIFIRLTRHFSYAYAVTISSAGVAAIATLLAINYTFARLDLGFDENFLTLIRILLPAPFLTSFLIFGGLGRLGLPGLYPTTRTVNKMIHAPKQVTLRDGLGIYEVRDLLGALNRLPKNIYLSSILDIFIILFILTLVGLGYGYSIQILLWIWLAGLIGLVMVPGTAYFLAEALTGNMRVEIQEKLWEQGLAIDTVTNATFRSKFKIVGLLYVICLGASNAVTYVNNESVFKTVVYLLILSALISLLTYLIFKGISRLIVDTLASVRVLKKGDESIIFSPYLDQEFMDLVTGINSASQTINDYRSNLEKKVRERTRQLEGKNAILNAVFTELSEKNVILEKEMDFAAVIQQGILEKNLKSWNGVNFAASYYPMVKVSGDYYDIFRFRHCVYIVLADVSGHGIPAALITMAAKEMFYRNIRQHRDTSDVFDRVNERMMQTVRTSDYMTSTLIRIDENNQVQFSNAGGPRTIVYHKKEDRFDTIDSPGFMLGALPEATGSYQMKTWGLEAGDRIHIYTDGLTEQRDANDEEIGFKRVLELFQDYRESPLNELHGHVSRGFESLRGNMNREDDVSFVSVELDPNWDIFQEYFNLGVKEWRDRKLDAAAEYFFKARDKMPEFPALKYYLARIYQSQGELDLARTMLKEYIKIIPDDDRARKLARKLFT